MVHMCQVILKSGEACRSYSPEMNFSPIFNNLTLVCDLDLEPTDLGDIHDTSPCYGRHMCQVILKSGKACGRYSSETNFSHTFNNLTWVYDLDLDCMDLGHMHDTSTCYGRHMYQVILKSGEACGSYNPETNFSPIFNHLTFICDLELEPTDLNHTHDIVLLW